MVHPQLPVLQDRRPPVPAPSAAADARDRRPVYQQTSDEVLAALGADPRRGLTGTEARARLERHGRNELAAEPPVPAWRKLLAQFQDALVILLVAATVDLRGPVALRARDDAPLRGARHPRRRAAQRG